MTLPELIASEVMDTIERERRINKDDLIIAAEVAIGKHERASVLQGVPYEDLTTRDMQNILTEQAMADAVKKHMRIDSQKGGGFEFYVNEPIPTGVPPSFTGAMTTTASTATAIVKPGFIDPVSANYEAVRDALRAEMDAFKKYHAKPGCISSAEAAQKAGFLNQAAPVHGQSFASMVDEARQRLIAKQRQAAAVRASKSWMTE